MIGNIWKYFPFVKWLRSITYPLFPNIQTVPIIVNSVTRNFSGIAVTTSFKFDNTVYTIIHVISRVVQTPLGTKIVIIGRCKKLKIVIRLGIQHFGSFIIRIKRNSKTVCGYFYQSQTIYKFVIL